MYFSGSSKRWYVYWRFMPLIYQVQSRVFSIPTTYDITTGFFKKNSHGTWQASNVRSPLQPPLQSCNWKGLNAPNLNGCFFWRPKATTRKKQLWSWGARGIPRLNLLFYRMAVFFEEPGLKRRALSQSLPALLFRTLRTLADSRTKDAKYHGRKTDGICVAGAALWDACCSFVWQALGFGSMMVVLRGPAMQLTCNTHATHSQHNTQHEHFSCKFSIKVRVVCQNLIFAFKDRILGQPLEICTFIENLQEKCSCCVLCWLCVACVLHDHHTSKAQRLPHKRAACVPKCCTCHTNTIGFL